MSESSPVFSVCPVFRAAVRTGSCAVQLDSIYLFIFPPCMQALHVFLSPWHLSCHYPVTALIKKASLPKGGVFYLFFLEDAGDRLEQTHTHRERLSLSYLTLSAATEGARVGSRNLELPRLYPGCGATERCLPSPFTAARDEDALYSECQKERKCYLSSVGRISPRS